ncbi:hypothetical protein M413DRAFT_445807 [Hebeloma cylindrosporum]|uniref:Uncharacterized protein n=1 Tax=Hebeloma cylindrosporum TaxID=76867 RepID=A0A0C2XTV1_HEBCY|nr:hypothetical protein M413DRAFT_445807 [Hebeloma cylindrosporum h7]
MLFPVRLWKFLRNLSSSSFAVSVKSRLALPPIHFPAPNPLTSRLLNSISSIVTWCSSNLVSQRRDYFALTESTRFSSSFPNPDNMGNFSR